MYLYQDEIKLLLSNNKKVVSVDDVAGMQERCFVLRQKYQAETVVVYLYQPATKQKTYKERIVFSTSRFYTPLDINKRINLASRSRILEEFKSIGYAKITPNSNHQSSPLIKAYNMEMGVVTPIRDVITNQIIGEVGWLFKENVDVDITVLQQEGQIFTYSVINN